MSIGDAKFLPDKDQVDVSDIIDPRKRPDTAAITPGNADQVITPVNSVPGARVTGAWIRCLDGGLTIG